MRLPHASRFSERGHHGRWQRGLGCEAPLCLRTSGGTVVKNEYRIEVRGSYLPHKTRKNGAALAVWIKGAPASFHLPMPNLPGLLNGVATTTAMQLFGTP